MFDSRDGGTAEAPLRYEGPADGSALISGGRELPPFQLSDDGLWMTHVPEVAAGRWYFEQLWVGDRRATRACAPNAFFSYMLDVEERPADPPAPPGAFEQTISVAPGDIASLAGLAPAELADVQLVAFHKWDNTRRFLKAADPSAGVLRIVGAKSKPWNPLGRDTGYRLENYRAALDSPGEWFLARDGKLLYKPRPGEALATTRAVAPVADKLLVIAGDASAGHRVEHLTVANLTFEHGQLLTPPGGFDPVQAAAFAEALITIDGARQVRFENCRIAHLGGYGLWLRRGCQECAVEHCYLHDLGAGGVRIGETAIPRSRPTRPDTMRWRTTSFARRAACFLARWGYGSVRAAIIA